MNGGRKSDNHVVVIEDAVVSYREDVALRGVSLEVEEGEIIGVIGPNGAGKTTILTLVNGLGKLLRGRVRVLGHDLSPKHYMKDRLSHLRKRIGYVPQVLNIDPRMPFSAREVVMMGRFGNMGVLRRPGDGDWEVVDRVMEYVGMEKLASRPIGHLSGGELQRVIIARALSQEPEILLLDEPTTALDRKARVEILDLVEDIHMKGGLTTLMVTHELKEVSRICGRLVLMKEGLIWRTGPPAEVLREDVLCELFDDDENRLHECCILD